VKVCIVLSPQDRAYFDEQLELVLAELPPLVKQLMDEVPMIVEDSPSHRLCKQLQLADPGELCGLYIGRSIDKTSSNTGVDLPDRVFLFREGILNSAFEENGTIPLPRLRDEIRLTILHEYGHHHGMDEDELRELGY
jgi:predicted Zn-dependent protease with MMP-like domain